MNHSSISPQDRAKQRAKQLNINSETLKDAFRILDIFQSVSKEFDGDWPDFNGAGNWLDDEYHAGNPDGFTIPIGGGVGTGIPVNVIPANKNHPRGKCRDILFVHVKKNSSRTAQLEIMNQTGRHVKTICKNTQIVIFHGTLDYYVWDEARHQLEKQLVFLQPIRHSYLVLDPDWR